MWWVLFFGLDKLHVSDWRVWARLFVCKPYFTAFCSAPSYSVSDLSSQIPPSSTSISCIFVSWRELKLTEGFTPFKVLIQMRVGLHVFLRLLASDQPFQLGGTEWHWRKCINGSELPNKIQQKLSSTAKQSLSCRRSCIYLFPRHNPFTCQCQVFLLLHPRLFMFVHQETVLYYNTVLNDKLAVRKIFKSINLINFINRADSIAKLPVTLQSLL